jgi:hypothetical protein
MCNAEKLCKAKTSTKERKKEKCLEHGNKYR